MASNEAPPLNVTELGSMVWGWKRGSEQGLRRAFSKAEGKRLKGFTLQAKVDEDTPTNRSSHRVKRGKG